MTCLKGSQCDCQKKYSVNTNGALKVLIGENGKTIKITDIKRDIDWIYHNNGHCGPRMIFKSNSYMQQKMHINYFFNFVRLYRQESLYGMSLRPEVLHSFDVNFKETLQKVCRKLDIETMNIIKEIYPVRDNYSEQFFRKTLELLESKNKNKINNLKEKTQPHNQLYDVFYMNILLKVRNYYTPEIVSQHDTIQARQDFVNQLFIMLFDKTSAEIMEDFRLYDTHAFEVATSRIEEIKTTIKSMLLTKISIKLDCEIPQFLNHENYIYYLHEWLLLLITIDANIVNEDKDISKYWCLINRGIWSISLYNVVVFVTATPLHISVDSKGNLHSLDGPAIKWIDNNGDNYFIDGIPFSKDLWEKIALKKMSCREILLIENIEQRRIALKFKGIYSLLDELDAILIDRSKRGTELYKIYGIAKDTNRSFQFVKYKDPSTNRVYVSAVPDQYLERDDQRPSWQKWKKIKTADQAMAWKFSLTEREYLLLEKES